MSEQYGNCPICNTPIRLPEPITYTPEAEMDMMGNRMILSTVSLIVGMILDCGHRMKGYEWTPDSGYVWEAE